MGSHILAKLRSHAPATRHCLLPAGCCALAVSWLCSSALADPTAVEPVGARRAPPPYSLRLSVLNGGQPRGEGLAAEEVSSLTAGVADPFAGERPRLSRDRWTFAGERLAEESSNEGAAPDKGQPIAGDFNGDGRGEIGLFVDGAWFIDLNGNGAWDQDDLYARLGSAGDTPLVGDWDGDGKADIGVFGVDETAAAGANAHEGGLPDAENPAASDAGGAAALQADRPVRLSKQGAQGAWRADKVDHVLVYGPEGGIPVAGDFNGDGIDTVAMFRDGHWWIDVDGNGRTSEADFETDFGHAGFQPVAGDFDGDGVDDIGVYRNGRWSIHTDRGGEQDQAVVVELGGSEYVPVVGDWDGDGVDDVAVFRSE